MTQPEPEIINYKDFVQHHTQYNRDVELNLSHYGYHSYTEWNLEKRERALESVKQLMSLHHDDWIGKSVIYHKTRDNWQLPICRVFVRVTP